MRFFAHDAGAPACGSAGESVAHRLLKMELASAIRSAGWHAELEIPGHGWRADVLATCPTSGIRMAWEAQLAAATSADLDERTAAMARDGVSVCWITDKDRPFLGHVPSIRIRTDDSDNSGPSSGQRSAEPTVIDGIGAFQSDWCDPRSACTICAQHGLYGRDEGPCSGHGSWGRPTVVLALAQFVRHVLAGTVRRHDVRTRPPQALGRHEPGNVLWTTRPHWHAEQEQLDATAVAAGREEGRKTQREAGREEEQGHLAAIAALEARQEALTPHAVELISHEARGYVGVRDRSPDWAMGIPLFVHDMPQGVIAPVASRINGSVRARLAPLTLFAASSAERDRLARVCLPGQRIEVYEVQVEVPSMPQDTVRLSPARAVDIMLGR
ncbi:competence protein CoiA family protein [Nocardioides alcanivorans]|uniref:competence protein CoiA family protein n=1 Tax=Nocardioides alcanivorans TaxID=2897352 RepID=UPI001F2B252E|nr:hypothetical protein [Nocardioides alcanivorans]